MGPLRGPGGPCGPHEPMRTVPVVILMFGSRESVQPFSRYDPRKKNKFIACGSKIFSLPVYGTFGAINMYSYR